MRLTTRQTGVISYAGLDEGALWEAARQAFALSSDRIPERFRNFLPLFPAELIVNMSYIGRGSNASPSGFSMAEDEYHSRLSQEQPDLYAGENRARLFDREGRFHGGAPVTVDRVWADAFPQYEPFLGERLFVHMIGGGHQAVAVPESIFPRGGGVLAAAERDMRVTASCVQFTGFVRQRLLAGDSYDPARFEQEYLEQTGLGSVCIRQKDLERVMQDMCIMRDLDSDARPEEMYTEHSRAAGAIPQYVPGRYACDVFEEQTVSRGTARLMQLYFSGERFTGDFWLPYQEACLYIHKQRATLDVRALCEGFQIAPACDADGRGGCYPDRVRVVVVRDRSLRLFAADVLNNPAYGSGMSPQGKMHRLIYLPRSQELLAQKRISEEPCNVTCIHTRVSEDEYLRMRRAAQWQEDKGRLIDAMYRRESALAQMSPRSAVYARACALLDGKVNALQAAADREPDSHGQRCGYDADVAYLRSKALHREGAEEAFALDDSRERSIECGYAMRSCARTWAMDELYAKPEPDRSRPRPQHARVQQTESGVQFEQMDMFATLPQDGESEK